MTWGALAKFMRLSLRKAAHADLDGDTYRKSGSPGFPVDLGGAGEIHAAFFTESRTRRSGWRHVQEIRVET